MKQINSVNFAKELPSDRIGLINEKDLAKMKDKLEQQLETFD